MRTVVVFVKQKLSCEWHLLMLDGGGARRRTSENCVVFSACAFPIPRGLLASLFLCSTRIVSTDGV